MAINMDQFLINKWSGHSFGPDFATVAGYPSYDWTTYDAYFFLQNELDITDEASFRAAQRGKTIRHCKVYRGKWLDYTIHKEFNTLAEWAADAGGKISDILYGVNRVHKKDYLASRNSGRTVPQTAKYVTLQHLLTYLGYVEPLKVDIPEYNAFDRFSDILTELEMINGPVPPQGRKCLIRKSDDTIVIGRVVDEKYIDSETADSQLRVVVPQASQYDTKSYDRLSDMPAGTTVYFLNSQGSFQSIDQLMSED